MELAPDVCPAACQDDAGVLGGMAAAGCVAVALEDAAEVACNEPPNLVASTFPHVELALLVALPTATVKCNRNIAGRASFVAILQNDFEVELSPRPRLRFASHSLCFHSSINIDTSAAFLSSEISSTLYLVSIPKYF